MRQSRASWQGDAKLGSIRWIFGDRPKIHVLKFMSTGTHEETTLWAKARERAAKGSQKVQKSVPTFSLVAWHSWTFAHAYGFFLTGLFGLSRLSFPKKTRAGTCCNVASPATLSTEVLPVLLLSSSVSLSINIHQTASAADGAERIFAKGARKARERNAKGAHGPGR